MNKSAFISLIVISLAGFTKNTAGAENPCEQVAQSASAITYKATVAGILIKVSPKIQQAYVDGKPALLTEETTDAQVYQQGLFEVVFYKRTHKVAVMKEGVFVERVTAKVAK